MASEEVKLAIQKDVDPMLVKIRETAEQDIKTQLKTLEEELEASFRSKYWAVLVAAISVALAALVLGVYAQRTTVNQAVIELQKDVASAQRVGRQSIKRARSAAEAV
jgi:hypothetical protein